MCTGAQRQERAHSAQGTVSNVPSLGQDATGSAYALQGLQGQAERHLGFILRPVGSPGEHYR